MVSATLERTVIGDNALDTLEKLGLNEFALNPGNTGSVSGAAEAPKKVCCHHWLIDRPNGPTSHGVCKYCHEERDFSNLPVIAVNRDAYDYSFRNSRTANRTPAFVH